MIVTLIGGRENGGYNGDIAVNFREAYVSKEYSQNSAQVAPGFTVSGYPSTCIINSNAYLPEEVFPATIDVTVTIPESPPPGTYNVIVVYETRDGNGDLLASYDLLHFLTVPCNLTATVTAPIGQSA